jgi:predicted RNA-binding protein YlqC (UPF0109 family)
MQGLIEFIARNLVDDPDAVEARVIRDDRYATVLRLHVNAEDLGKVIGRQGRVAKAMRTLMRASGSLAGKRHVGLEIDDRGSPPPQHTEQQTEPEIEFPAEPPGEPEA